MSAPELQPSTFLENRGVKQKKILFILFIFFQQGTPFKACFQGPMPLTDYFELIDSHFNVRLAMENYKELLQQRAHQFRVIQKRLLTRFKDKTPSPLQHLDTLLEGTYKQVCSVICALYTLRVEFFTKQIFAVG